MNTSLCEQTVDTIDTEKEIKLMSINKVRQILKTLADDTRLRIINLLGEREMSVSEICGILDKNQSNISKHLSRLRLTEIVGDRREGNNVYYFLAKQNNKAQEDLINAIRQYVSDIDIFKADIAMLKELSS